MHLVYSIVKVRNRGRTRLGVPPGVGSMTAGAHERPCASNSSLPSPSGPPGKPPARRWLKSHGASAWSRPRSACLDNPPEVFLRTGVRRDGSRRPAAPRRRNRPAPRRRALGPRLALRAQPKEPSVLEPRPCAAPAQPQRTGRPGNVARSTALTPPPSVLRSIRAGSAFASAPYGSAPSGSGDRGPPPARWLPAGVRHEISPG